jgi:undecaprenyl-diphosphatase
VLRWLFVAVFAVLFGTLMYVVVPAGHPVAVDVAVAEWVGAHRGPVGVAVFTGVSFAGSVLGLVPITIGLAWWLRKRSGNWMPVWWLGGTMIGATLLYVAVNIPMERPRPPMGLRLYEDAAWSFPSGHSTQAMAFWIMVATLVTAGCAPRVVRAGYAAAAVMILLIGCSRVYLCAHWTTDVLAGFSLGAAWVATVLLVRARRSGG